METNTSLVDDFLRGGGGAAIKRTYSPTGENDRGATTTSADVFTSNQGGGAAASMSSALMNANALVNVFSLQQRLVSIMNEAQSIIAQLQECGMFPKMTDNDSIPAVTMLLSSLMQHSSSTTPSPPHQGTGMYTAEISPSIHSSPAGNTMWDEQDPTNIVSMLAARGAATATSADGMLMGGVAQSSEAVFDFDPIGATSATYDYADTDDAVFATDQVDGDSGGDNSKSSNGNSKNHHYLSNPQRGGTEGRGSGAAGGARRRGGEDSGVDTYGHSKPSAGHTSRGAPACDPNVLAFVEFKRGRIRKYVCDEENLEPGGYVLVDGDRGTDCGLLVQTIKQTPNGDTSVICMDGCDVKDDKVKLENGRVLRAASNDEIDRLHNIIANAEAVALKTCRQRCEELGIDIVLLDVEYQFDMKKISFFFDCDHSVDFRSLVRELYRTFGARIWMENVNPKVKNSMPDGGHYSGGGGSASGRRGGDGEHGRGGGGGGSRHGYRRRN